MASRQPAFAMRQLGAIWDGGAGAGLSDAELLGRFNVGLGALAEAAFTALVDRHGPLVLGTCRRLLRDPRDVEDAFQATFLVLVRKAGSLRVGDSLAPWIYTVARRVATRVRNQAARGRKQGLNAVGPTLVAPAVEAPGDDLRRVLDEEIGRLPEKYRAPIVLCHLEGQSHEAAARALHWKVGTLSGRLSRGRDLLRARLVRRGVVVPALAFSAALRPPSSTPVPSALAESTIRIATGPIDVLLTPAGVVARRLLRVMHLGRWSRAGSVALALALAVGVVRGLGRPPDPAPAAGPLRPIGELVIPITSNDPHPLRLSTEAILEYRLYLHDIHAEVPVLEARRKVVDSELTKAATDWERARIEASLVPEPEGAAGKEGRTKLERLKDRVERLKAESSRLSHEWSMKQEEGVELDSFIRRPH